MFLGDDIVRWIRKRDTLLPIHAEWVRSSFNPDIQISALSIPRGNAKTWLFGWLGACALTPGSPLWREGIEVLGVSSSFEQSRVMMGFLRDALEGNGQLYRSLDSGQRLAMTHEPTNTKMRILSSSGKRAMGLSQFSTIFADEPGSWESRGGAIMFDALRTSLGKLPGQRLLLIGTRAPSESDGWWPNLLDAGSGKGTHVQVLTAPDDEPWDAWSTIRKVNPLINVNENLRKTILRERDDARRNPSMRPAFEAYRLNRQVDVHRDVLIPAGCVAAGGGPRGSTHEKAVLSLVSIWDRGAFMVRPHGRCGRTGDRSVTHFAPGVPDLEAREKNRTRCPGVYIFVCTMLTVFSSSMMGLRVSRPIRSREPPGRHVGINPR